MLESKRLKRPAKKYFWLQKWYLYIAAEMWTFVFSKNFIYCFNYIMRQLVWYYSNPTPCRRKFTIIALAGSYQLPHTAVAATPKTYKCTNFTTTPFSNQNYKKPNFQISPSRQCICKKGLLTTQLMYFSCQMVFVSLFCTGRGTRTVPPSTTEFCSHTYLELVTR